MIIPRASNCIPTTLLQFHERQGWWAQLKMNGTYTLPTIRDGVFAGAINRHEEQHKAPGLDFNVGADVWRHVPKGEWTFCAELMHSKVPGIRNTHYIHDVVVADGKSMVGTTYRERWELLGKIFGTHVVGETDYYWVLSDNMWLAKCLRPGANYAARFKLLTRPEEEGFVLKDPNGRLMPRDNDGWTVKCRRPHKNAGF